MVEHFEILGNTYVPIVSSSHSYMRCQTELNPMNRAKHGLNSINQMYLKIYGEKGKVPNESAYCGGG